MFHKIGFIGAGNMASAIINGIQAAGISGNNILVYDVDTDKTSALQKKTGCVVCPNGSEVMCNAEITILAVKPDKVMPVLQELRPKSTGRRLVSIAAGISASTLLEATDARIARIMPNTPALVGQGMIVISANTNYSDEELEDLKALFQCVGRVEVVPDKLMDVVTGCSGSGPAFVYLFIEALADAAVLEGAPRELAYTLAAQTVLGSAKMVLDSSEHPGKLKDNVCSPGGTTIAGVYALEESGFRAAAMEAVIAATEKSKEMGQ